MENVKILNFGSCNIDFVYSVEHIVRKGETITTNKLETFPTNLIGCLFNFKTEAFFGLNESDKDIPNLKF